MKWMDVVSGSIKEGSVVLSSRMMEIGVIGMNEWNYSNLKTFGLTLSPFPFLLIPHCILSCRTISNKYSGQDTFLHSLILSILVAYSGSIFVSLLLQTPLALLQGFGGDLMMLTLIGSWILVRFVPPFRSFISLRFVSATLMFLGSFVRLRNVMFMTKSLLEGSTVSVWACVFLGGLVGTGGALCVDLDSILSRAASFSSTVSSTVSSSTSKQPASKIVSNISSPTWFFCTAYLSSSLVVLCHFLLNSVALRTFYREKVVKAILEVLPEMTLDISVNFPFGIGIDDCIFVVDLIISVQLAISELRSTKKALIPSSKSIQKPVTATQQKAITPSQYVAKNSPGAKKLTASQASSTSSTAASKKK